MPDISQPTWSETDSANTAAPPDGWPEHQAPSTVNDCARMMMGAIKRFWNRINPVRASSGGANAYVLMPDVPLGAYAVGEVYSFRAGFTNTGPATLDMGPGPKSIRKLTPAGKTDLAPGDILTGQAVQVFFDGSDFVPLGATGRELRMGLHTLWVPARAMTANLTNGATPNSVEFGANKRMVDAMDFAKTAEQSAQFNLGLPKSWNRGTITFLPVGGSTAGAGNVVWQLQAVGIEAGGSYDTPFGVGQNSVMTVGAANTFCYGPLSPAVTVAGTLSSPMGVACRISRKASDPQDTLNGTASLLWVWVLIGLNTADDS